MPKLQPWDEYVVQVSEIHKNQYRYPNPIPKDGKIEVICLLHGSFWVRKNAHKSGRGCPKCFLTPFNSPNQTVWNRAKSRHPDFDFSKAVYVSINTPVTVICPKHGEFQSTPQILSLAHGCRECGRESAEAHLAKRRRKSDGLSILSPPDTD